jgi:hypothetical protein
MANAHVLIDRQTLATNTNTVTFSTIPGTYRDLRLVISGTMSSSSSPSIRFNGDAGANYSYVSMYGFSSGPASTSTSGATQGPCGWIPTSPTGQFTLTIDIMDYSATDKHKTFITRGSDTGSYVDSVCTRWNNTAAITSILVTGYLGGGTYAAGTTMSLYGVLA